MKQYIHVTKEDREKLMKIFDCSERMVFMLYSLMTIRVVRTWQNASVRQPLRIAVY